MSPRTRLLVCAAVVVSAGIYGLLVYYSPHTAETLSRGYVVALLTAIAVVNFWKKA